jgi:hypothetical protein
VPPSLFAGVVLGDLLSDVDALSDDFAGDDDDDLLSLPGFADEYRSAYQPPPFRMKLPPLICRLAVALPHFGQF